MRDPSGGNSHLPPTAPTHLGPRKTPRQARAAATVEAIFGATIQVLVAEGPKRLTTTRVAERAGVSVGTLYQYFSHKEALIYALNARYLDVLAEKVEAVCIAHRGVPAGDMAEALVAVYWGAKMAQPEATRALYRSVAEIDNASMIETFARRVDAATAAMFASASDADLKNKPDVNLTLLIAIFGSIRNLFERDLPQTRWNAVRGQLVVMCRAYLAAH